VLTTPLVGWMIDRAEPRVSMLCGLAIYSVSCYLMMLADLRIGVCFVIVVYVVRGIGLGFLYPPVFAVATSGIAAQRVRGASSLLNLWVTLGGAFSIAVLSTLVESRQAIHQALFAEEQVLTALGTQQALTALGGLSGEGSSSLINARLQALGMVQGIVRQEALIRAINDCFMLVCVLALGSMGVVMLMRMVRQR